MIQEIELKLSCEPEVLQKIENFLYTENSLFHDEKQAISDYYDTKDCQLAKLGYILRVRHVDQHYIQTIKKDVIVNQNGLHQRDEWEINLPNNQLNLADIPTKMSQYLQQHQLAQQLKIIFQTIFTRNAFLILFNNSKIEVALDYGEIISGQAKIDICECELELKEGNTEDLFAYAEKLKQCGKLQPELQSKAEKGYGLYRILEKM